MEGPLATGAGPTGAPGVRESERMSVCACNWEVKHCHLETTTDMNTYASTWASTDSFSIAPGYVQHAGAAC